MESQEDDLALNIDSLMEDDYLSESENEYNIEPIPLYFLSNSPIMNITQSLIKMSTSSVQMDNTVNFGDKMEYRKVTDGYDLFVLS